MPNTGIVKELETHIRRSIIGEDFPLMSTSVVGNFVIKSPVKVPDVLESLTGSLIEKYSHDSNNDRPRTIFEPNGPDTFPDVELYYNSTRTYPIEVKTTKADIYDVPLISIKQLIESTLNNDLTAWKTNWFIYKYNTGEESHKVSILKTGRIWELSGPNDSNGVKLIHKRTFYYIAVSSKGFCSPLSFIMSMKNLMTSERFGYSTEVTELFYKNALKIIERVT